MKTYVALLRAINVGGKNKLPMTDLVEIFSDAGCVNVRSYIQSGNVIFSASPRCAARLPVLIPTRVGERFGHKPPIILRTAEQIETVFATNPFLKMGAPEETLHVMFLADVPAPGAVKALDPDRSPPDTFLVQGQEIYLRMPNGMGETKLTNAYFDSKLATISTARNWRTVGKLLELMRG
ncbi:MAG TPA: DUF1697 domain-containing protein [Bryobacteraceae bacterium]|nr:DUF1697 domain-containing protein [Bryobacteraceae bacterium]